MAKSKKSNYIIQLRDARLPLTSVNQELHRITQTKKHLIVFSKSDLISLKNKKSLQKQFPLSIFTDSSRNYSYKKLLRRIVSESQTKFLTTFAVVTVVGYPNVGKSTLINKLRIVSKSESVPSNKKVKAKVAPVPCFTKSITPFIISRDPNVVLFDTPGIFAPSAVDLKTALKLSLVGTVNESNRFFENEVLARFLLMVLNELKQEKYTRLLKVSRADDLENLLEEMKRRFRFSRNRCLQWFLRLYREGSIGQFVLDTVKVDNLIDREVDQILG